MHRQGVNVSTNAMWSTRAREFLTHTQRAHTARKPLCCPYMHMHTRAHTDLPYKHV